MKMLNRVLTVLNLGVVLFLLWAWAGRTEWAAGRPVPESAGAIGPLRPWLEIGVVFLIMIGVVKLWQTAYGRLGAGPPPRRTGSKNPATRRPVTSGNPSPSIDRDDGPGPTADPERGPLVLLER